MSRSLGPGLFGRCAECEALDRLLADVRAGRSSVLVLRGGEGCGKTALLRYVLERASDCRVARVAGVESEMGLAFAGLHQLCASMLGRLEHLPGPQRDALCVAFGLSAGDAPDRFLVGLATLSLLSEVAEEQPLVCLVDDVQWLDRASVQAMAFVVRRLLVDRVGAVFTVREPCEDERALSGLPELIVDGLDDRDVRLLLAATIRVRMDEQVRDRIVAEARGNPLALMELARGLTPAGLAGGFALPDAQHLASRVEQGVQRRVEALPDESRRLLLAAAAEPVGDVALLAGAADRLGIGVEAAAPAEAAGLIELGTRVRFHHPLVRSAVYRAAALRDRRAAHLALAEATDPELDPDRRAWHRAHAALGSDEALASELESSTDRAQGRGGVGAAAALLERAVELTPDPARRGQRALAAAQAKVQAGAPDAAYELLATAEMGPLDELQRAQLQHLRAQIAFGRRRGSDAPPLLLDAAKRLEPLDARLARETYLEAISAAVIAGRLSNGGGVLEVAEAARVAPPAPLAPRAIDLLLDGLVTRFTEGYAASVGPLARALRAFRAEVRATGDLRWLGQVCRVAAELWDEEAWYELSTRHVRLAREAGALDVLPIAATYLAGVYLHTGEFAAAAALIEESDAITDATGNAPHVFSSLALAAFRGQEAEVSELSQTSMQDANRRGEGRAMIVTEYATALLCNGLRRYDVALAAAQRAFDPDAVGLAGLVLIELIEAATRAGRRDVAAGALRRLGEQTRAAATDWALGSEARSRALLSDGRAAEALYREAVERFSRTRSTVQLARAHLLYGEWLRREKRRLDAREQLRLAHDMFSQMGADAFAQRTRRELLATGETMRKRTDETLDQLTAQEAQISQLARNGRTNPEIGAELFISPRTVEYHLRKVFTKLGIHSRAQLHDALPEPNRPIIAA